MTLYRLLRYWVTETYYNARWLRVHQPVTLTDVMIRARLKAIRRGED